MKSVIFAVPSNEALATTVPFGSHRTQETESRCRLLSDCWWNQRISPVWTSSKILATFDTRLSNILIWQSRPHDANKFPLLGHTSIQYALSNKCAQNMLAYFISTRKRRNRRAEICKVVYVRSAQHLFSELRLSSQCQGYWVYWSQTSRIIRVLRCSYSIYNDYNRLANDNKKEFYNRTVFSMKVRIVGNQSGKKKTHVFRIVNYLLSIYCVISQNSYNGQFAHL